MDMECSEEVMYYQDDCMLFIQIEGMTACSSESGWCGEDEVSCYAYITVDNTDYEGECQDLGEQFDYTEVYEEEEYFDEWCTEEVMYYEEDCMAFIQIEGMTACTSESGWCGEDEVSCYASISVDGTDYNGTCEELGEQFDYTEIYEDEEYYDEWCTEEIVYESGDCMAYFETEGMTSCFAESGYCGEYEVSCYGYITVDGTDYEGYCEDLGEQFDYTEDYSDWCEDYEEDCMEFVMIEGMTACNSWGTFCSDESADTCTAEITVYDEIY
jgi:hypothetical protein